MRVPNPRLPHPGLTAYHPLVRAVDQALRGPCGLPRDRPCGLLVAVSGGADSVALCRALHLLASRRGRFLRLVIGHVQHHLRGAVAEREALWVARLAGELQLPFQRRDITPAQARGNLEAIARRQRYAALMEMAQAEACPWIITAHHGDDQLETLLMRLLRGSGLDGMRGLRWRRPLANERVLLRPMLRVDRSMAEDYLRGLGQPWCEDQTNADTRRVRARLRHMVLPVLRSVQPQAAGQAQTWAEHCQTAAGLLRRSVRAADRQHPEDELERAALRQLDPLVLAGLLRLRLRRAGVPADALSAAALQPLLRAVRDGRGGERHFAFAGGTVVRLLRERLELFAAQTERKKPA